MSSATSPTRRSILAASVAVSIAAPQLAQLDRATPSNTQTASSSPTARTSFAALKQIEAGVLNIGFAEDGPADGPPVLLLHGWPYDIYSYVDVTIEGDADGAPHPDPAAYAKRFIGRYENRLFKGGIGHNPPKEAPSAFAQAVIDADRF